MGCWRVASRASGRYSPAPAPPPPSQAGSVVNEPLRPRDCWTLAPGIARGVPNPSEATCTLNHQQGALSSRTAGTTRSGLTPALPRPFSGAAQPGLEKLGEGFPPGTPTGVQGIRMGGDGTRASAPSPTPEERREGEECGVRGEGRIPGARGRTCRQEVPCLHCPGNASHCGANASVGAGALDLGPSSARTKGRPSPPVLRGWGDRPTRHPPGTAQLQSLRGTKRSGRAVLPGDDSHLRHPTPRAAPPSPDLARLWHLGVSTR